MDRSRNSRWFSCLLAAALLAFGITARARQAHPLQNPLAAQLAAKLQADLHRVAAGLDGSIGIYAENLQTGQSFSLHAGQTFPQASSIKIPLLIALLRQDQQGRLHLTDRVQVRRSQMVGGSGVLQTFGDGTSSLALRDLAALMVVLSDNSAANILIDRVGMDRVNAFLKTQGLDHTRLNRKMIDQAAERAGRENISTPREMATLLARLERGKLLDRAHTATALSLLEDYKETPLRAGLPPGLRVADKPGSLSGVRCDSGIVFLDGSPYVLSVMTAYDRDAAAAGDAITAVSRAVFSYFDRIARSNSFGVLVHPPASP
jgi:beta-lactamase class A